jgi:hypothetical protein
MSTDKAPVAPPTEEELLFEPRKMVGWFDPAQLVGTGIKAMLSGIFGAYADKREVQAALYRPDGKDPFHHYENEDEIWFDFVADLGDGFDSTYTIARLLAENELQLKGSPEPMPRGRIVVLGGDQVYPTAKREEYRDRFECPYRFAFPWTPADAEKAPHLFAIPGNHDWYDGLTSFTRLFCQQRWIGGWKTRQARSYFALRLPHNWWLWGIDIQLEADVDRPQLEYFQSIAKRPDFKGARIILCTGAPSWVATLKEGPEAYQNLGVFENTVVHENGGRVVLTLTGDLHHYCRYRNGDATSQKITAGGGGAYLYGTHHLPDSLELDDVEDDKPPVKYTRAEVYPDFPTSRRLSLAGLLRFPFRNWKFSLLLGAFYALNAWIVQSASEKYGVTLLGQLALAPFSLSGLKEALWDAVRVLAHSPASVAFSLLLLGGLIAFADGNKKRIKCLVGGIHALLHLALNVVLSWIFVRISVTSYHYGSLFWPADRKPIPSGVAEDILAESLRHTLFFSAEMLIIGSLLAGFLFSVYLVVGDLIFGLHTNEAFSSQSISDYKNFLRLHVDKNGRLRVFPIGIDTVCKDWKYKPGATNGAPFYEPDDRAIAESAHLIEDPISFEPPSTKPPVSVSPSSQT